MSEQENTILEEESLAHYIFDGDTFTKNGEAYIIPLDHLTKEVINSQEHLTEESQVEGYVFYKDKLIIVFKKEETKTKEETKEEE